MKQKLQKIVTHKVFRYCFLALTIIFIISTFFITLNPKGFIKYGYFGIIFFNIISSGLLLIPALIKTLNLPLIVLSCAVGNIVNTSINYLVGSSGKSFLLNSSFIQRVKKLMKRFEGLAIFLLAIVPLPLDVNGLLSGYLGIPLKKYLFFNFLGKVTIFTLVGLGVITLTEHN